jgi:hypothetical protein
MTASQLNAGRPAVAAPSAALAGAADINDNGSLGWPDLLAWLFFGAVGLLGVAVVAGVAFGGAAVAVHEIRRMAELVWVVARHRHDPGTVQRTSTSWTGRTDPDGQRINTPPTSDRWHREVSHPR